MDANADDITRALATTDLTDPVVRRTILGSFVQHQLKKLNLVDQSAVLGEVTRLRLQHSAAVYLGKRAELEPEHDVLATFRQDVAAELLACVQDIGAPAAGFFGGWVLLDPARPDDVPNLGMFPDTLVPAPAVGTVVPVWRTHAGAAAALQFLRDRGWRASEHLEPDWTPIAVTDNELGFEVLDDVYWAGIRDPVVRGRAHFDGHADARGTLAVIAVPPDDVQQLADRYAPMFGDQYSMATVAADRLHLTLWSGWDRAQPATGQFTTALRDRVAQRGPVPVAVGQAVLSADGVALDVLPTSTAREAGGDAVTQLITTLADLAQQCGAEPGNTGAGVSLPIAYSTSSMPMDLTGINAIRGRVTWQIDELLVAHLSIDSDQRSYRWDILDTIGLTPSV